MEVQLRIMRKRKDKYLTAPEAAEILGVHVKTLYRWAKEERIPSIQIRGRGVRFSEAAVKRWLKSSIVERGNDD